MTRSPFGSPSRRTFLGLGAAGLSAPLLASCAGGGSSGELGSVDLNVPSAFSGREVNIAVWSSMSGNNGEVLQGLVTQFNGGIL